MLIHSMIVAEKERTPGSWLTGIGAILLFFGLVTFTAIGAAIVLGVTPRPRIVGWPILVLSVAAALRLMDYWVRVLPGILGCAALNGLIITVSGHALNQPSVPVNRLIAALATVSVGLSAFLATAFMHRALTTLDRTLGFGILAGFAVAFSPSQMQVLGLVVIVVCVAVAWFAKRQNVIHPGRHRA